MAVSRFRNPAYLAALLLAGGVAAAGCKTDGINAAKYPPPAPPRDLGLHAYGASRHVRQGGRGAGTD